MILYGVGKNGTLCEKKYICYLKKAPKRYTGVDITHYYILNMARNPFGNYYPYRILSISISEVLIAKLLWFQASNAKLLSKLGWRIEKEIWSSCHNLEINL